MASTPMRVAIALLFAAGGCGGGGGSTPTVPEGEGTVEVRSESLVAVSSDACHVQGVVANVSTGSTFDVTLHWQAFDASGKAIATTRATIPRLRPAEQRSYDATGFASNSTGLVPCSRIARFARDATLITPR